MGVKRAAVRTGTAGRASTFTSSEENAMSVEVGDMAPDFELPSHNGGKIKLSDYRGKKNVFIAFYPLAWTPV
jgi:peroxiredoxin